MAISYHEGLPGAGKSYEACMFHILPALKAHRRVITNIRGVNYAKFAELADEPEDLIRLLLIYVEPAEQDDDAAQIQRCINEIADKTPDNALIVWDEIQDYFPSGNYKLPLNQQKFWTEHRHRGLDIVIMGQDRDDVHKIIRSRIRDVVYFLKLEAVGFQNTYKWTLFQKQDKGKFVKTNAGTRTYDPKYFGLYMSHRREGVKAGVYTTKRTNMLANSKGLVWGVPLALCAAFYALTFLWDFFHPQPKQAASSVSSQRALTNPPPPALVNPPPPGMTLQAAPNPAETAKAAEQPPPVDYFDKLAQTLQVRCSAIIDSQKPGKELLGYIELLDQSYHVKEKFSVDEIRALGWTVTRTGYGLLLEKQGVSYVARSWPIDLFGRVDNRTVDALGGPSASARAAQSEEPSGARVVVIPDTEYASRPWRSN